MDKWLCWASMGVAGLVILLFLLDFITGLIMTSGIPFGFISPVMDVIAILAGGVVIFLAWDAMRDLR
ncbi:MAG TPA: hypothetical protein VFA26_21395 [Gemmataceae bacterium]|nr:hypothetical protein [Gemmataceae bacterium]